MDIFKTYLGKLLRDGNLVMYKDFSLPSSSSPPTVANRPSVH